LLSETIRRAPIPSTTWRLISFKEFGDQNFTGQAIAHNAPWPSVRNWILPSNE